MTLVVTSGTLAGMQLRTRLDRLLWLVEYRADGNQRELARRAGLAGSHIGTILTRLRRSPDAEIEGGTVAAIAAATGVHEAWIISGREPRDLSGASPTTISDRIHPVIARVASAAKYTEHEAETASTLVRGLAGTDSMTEEQALELLSRVRLNIRDAERALAPTIVRDSGGSALDDLSGGKGGPKPKRRR